MTPRTLHCAVKTVFKFMCGLLKCGQQDGVLAVYTVIRVLLGTMFSF